MANVDDRFEMPDGSVYVIRHPEAESGGEFVEIEFILPGDCVAPPPHVHPHQVEEYEVIEGSLEVMVDGDWSTYRQGELASVPVGSLHTFRNPTGGPIRLRNVHRPAMGFEDFIESTCAQLEKSGVKSGRDPRVPIILSTMMLRDPEPVSYTHLTLPTNREV